MATIAAVPLKGVSQARTYPEAAIIVVAATIFFGCLIAPPALMDDVDAVHGHRPAFRLHCQPSCFVGLPRGMHAGRSEKWRASMQDWF